jgi:site-specific DNA-methyltransferase (cytosine-N4-specific)
MLTDPGDLVVDPFAGSCITGEVAERLQRRWTCSELVEEYVKGARGRFETSSPAETIKAATRTSYAVSNSAYLWNGIVEPKLSEDGGKTRPTAAKKSNRRRKASAE